jgi:hypothetical protein
LNRRPILMGHYRLTALSTLLNLGYNPPACT